MAKKSTTTNTKRTVIAVVFAMVVAGVKEIIAIRRGGKAKH